MASLIMANMNTLIRKGYLLAGVVMAANMFIVDEVRAMNSNTEEKEKDDDEENNNNQGNITKEKKTNAPVAKSESNILDKVLFWENTINLIGGAAFSSVNNYFRWWDYNAGGYRKLGCSGWRSGRFLKDYLQFEINLNVGRGILWLVPTIFGSYQYLRRKKDPRDLTATAAVIINAYKKGGEESSDYSLKDIIFFFFLSSVQGFVSVPLAIHISNFSIAISLDSIFWASVGILSHPKKGKEENGYVETKNEGMISDSTT